MNGTIGLIYARSLNNVIGINNKLPWNIPEDLEFFKEKTLNCIVVMGKNTWESLNKKPLKNRINVIVSESLYKDNKNYGDEIEIDLLHKALLLDKKNKLYIVKNIETALLIKVMIFKDIPLFFIGGKSIYKEAIKHCSIIYETVVQETYDTKDAIKFTIHEYSNFYKDFTELEFYKVNKTSENGLKYCVHTYVTK